VVSAYGAEQALSLSGTGTGTLKAVRHDHTVLPVDYTMPGSE